jgi:hypothetical protein
MPVLSETTASTAFPGQNLTYVFLGAVALLLVGVLISRRKSRNSATARNMSLPSTSEKSILQESTSFSPPMAFPQHHHPSILSRPPQPLPFTPPTLSTTIFPAPESSSQSPISSSPGGLNQSYYDSPIELDSSTFTPFSQVQNQPEATTILYSESSDLPRRRSYTKTTGESSMSGEIITAEGWRRHTRVFGGGVCKACEESERRMSA